MHLYEIDPLESIGEIEKYAEAAAGDPEAHLGELHICHSVSVCDLVRKRAASI